MTLWDAKSEEIKYFYKLVLTKSAKFFMKKQNCYGNLDKILSSLNYWGLFLLAAFTLWTCSDSDWEILLYYFEKFVHFWKRQYLLLLYHHHIIEQLSNRKNIFLQENLLRGKSIYFEFFFYLIKILKTIPSTLCFWSKIKFMMLVLFNSCEINRCLFYMK